MKNNQLALTATDFMQQNKINFNSFTNVQVETDFVSEKTIALIAREGKYGILSKAQLEDFHKGEGSDIDVNGKTQRVVVRREDGTLSEVFLFEKSQAKSNDIEKGGGDDIEKAILNDYNNKFEFKKSGKEIKEKLKLVKDRLSMRVTDLASKAADLLSKIDEKPERIMSEWEFGPYKDQIGEYALFEYDKCYFREDNQFNGTVNGNLSKEICDICCKYNDIVYNIVYMKKDICECDTFINNLSDTEKYTLSTDQLVKLGF